MDLIEWLLLAVVLTNIAVLVYLRRITSEQIRANRQQTTLLGLLTARHSKVRMERTSQQAPGVDARAKTQGRGRPIKFRQVGGPGGDQSE